MSWLDCGIGRCDGCPDERRVFQPSDEPVLVLCSPCIKRWSFVRASVLAVGEARPASPKANYYRERRERLKAKGLCIDCARRPALSGITRCAKCREVYLRAKSERRSA